MSFADLLPDRSVIFELASSTREDVLREILSRVQERGLIPKGTFEEILKRLIERETLGSTGIGNGVAVPHAKHTCVTSPFLTVARSGRGINFGSLDGEPVHLFFLLLSPEKNTTEHLKALTFISTALRDEFFCKFLKNASSIEEMEDTIREMDEKTRG